MNPWEDPRVRDGLPRQLALLAEAEREGARRIGWKVGFGAPASLELMQIEAPLLGFLTDRTLLADAAEVEVGDWVRGVVEFEVAVRMGADLTADAGPHTRESVADAVSACHASFELVEDRNADYSSLNVFDLVAENAWNAAVVLADAVTEWRSVDLVDAATRLTLNGEPAGKGRTGDALGHPLEAVAFLANNLNSRGQSLRAGQFVMTGSSIVTQFPSAGDELVFTIEGLGEVSLICH